MIMRTDYKRYLLPETSSNEYIFFACPFCETSNTSRLADVFQQWWTETSNCVFVISFKCAQRLFPKWTIVFKFEINMINWKNTTHIVEFYSIKVCKFSFRFEFNNPNVIILRSRPGKQLRLRRDAFYLSNNLCEWWWRKITKVKGVSYRCSLLTSLWNSSVLRLAIALIPLRRDWMNPLFQ